MLKKKVIEKILKKIKPSNFQLIINFKGNLLDEQLLDSFDIIQLCIEIEKVTKKKINSSKLIRKNFSNIKEISKFV